MTGKLVIGIAALLLGLSLVSHFLGEREAAKQASLAAREAAAREAHAKAVRDKLFADFARDRAAILANLGDLAARKKWQEAREVAVRWKDIDDKEYIAIAAVIFDNWSVQEKKRVAAEAKAAEKADLALRKSRGVKVGMTAEEVLKSSWGRPERVNRTTTARTVREQWVYGRNYLYFENGILTAVQN